MFFELHASLCVLCICCNRATSTSTRFTASSMHMRTLPVRDSHGTLTSRHWPTGVQADLKEGLGLGYFSGEYYASEAAEASAVLHRGLNRVMWPFATAAEQVQTLST
jgi:hypothetical protein